MIGEGRNHELRGLCMMLYFLFALSAVLQFFLSTLVMGILVLILAYIITSFKLKAGAARKTPFESHLQYLSGTFWVGCGVIMPIAAVIAGWMVWKYTDLASVMDAMNADDSDTLFARAQSYFVANTEKIHRIVLWTTLPTLFWWLRRCWVGFVRSKHMIPIDYPNSWF